MYLDIILILFIYLSILLSMYDPLQVKIMHCKSGMTNLWKCLTDNNEIWNQGVV